MKKNISDAKSPQRKQITKIRKSDRVTIGMDLGDKASRYCALNAISWLTTQMEATIVRDRGNDPAAGLEPSTERACLALPVRERLSKEQPGIGPANRPIRRRSA